MGLFGPLFGGFERCLRGVSLGYGRLDLSGVPQIGPQNGPFRPSGTSDLGLAMFNTRISYDIHTLNVGRISGLDPYLDPFWSRCGPNGARGWTPNPPPSMPRHPNT